MKLHSTLLLLGTLFCTPVFAVDRLAIDVGASNHYSKGSDTAFLRFVNDLTIPTYPEIPAYSEVFVGSWDDDLHNSAVGLGLGLQQRWRNFHVDVGAGVAYLSRETRLSSTHQQFMLRIGFGYTLDKVDVALFQTHFSNDNNTFEWGGKNVGYDFLSLQVSYALK